ncbi:MAG: hypothetical protein ACRDL7_07270 [Gaiellaceae bacterium]
MDIATTAVSTVTKQTHVASNKLDNQKLQKQNDANESNTAKYVKSKVYTTQKTIQNQTHSPPATQMTKHPKQFLSIKLNQIGN